MNKLNNQLYHVHGVCRAPIAHHIFDHLATNGVIFTLEFNYPIFSFPMSVNIIPWTLINSTICPEIISEIIIDSKYHRYVPLKNLFSTNSPLKTEPFEKTNVPFPCLLWFRYSPSYRFLFCLHIKSDSKKYNKITITEHLFLLFYHLSILLCRENQVTKNKFLDLLEYLKSSLYQIHLEGQFSSHQRISLVGYHFLEATQMSPFHLLYLCLEIFSWNDFRLNNKNYQSRCTNPFPCFHQWFGFFWVQ